mmetsp:Transcript_21595/g.88062  ORF Transcript_21595/g.88062 Transcript_21595/m.88062 type:complete len:169 (+) Transcript_21595:365-871(+)
MSTRAARRAAMRGEGHFKIHSLHGAYPTPRSSRLKLPDRHFLNLDSTNAAGLKDLHRLVTKLVPKGEALQYVNLRSEDCEGERFRHLIKEFDQNLAVQLACGHRCFVYGFSRGGEFPRAITHGVPFVKFTLGRAWRYERMPVTSGLGAVRYFNRNLQVTAIDRASAKR